MNRRSNSLLLALAVVAGVTISAGMASKAPATAAPGQVGDGVNWPSFRGPNASGIAEGFPTATSWNAETSENVLWKTPIPGLAHSSPIVWDDKVFVTTAISSSDNSLKIGVYGDVTPVEDSSDHVWRVYCLDKATGRILWEHTPVTGVPTIKRHAKSTHANPTLVTDGTRVVAFFGSEGLFAYSMGGELLWQKDLGVLDAGFFIMPQAQWAVASSPIIHDGAVIIQADVQTDSFLAAFDLTDGSELWRTPRDDVPTWSTPNVVEFASGAQLIVNGFRHIGGYDPETGRELWRLRGGGDIPVPTPVVAHDLIFITNAHGPMAPIYAVRPTARGEISLTGDESSNEYIAWSQPREGSYMQTPLVYGDFLYVCRWNGVLSVYDARTGERMYRQRLGEGGGFSASPVAANGMVYIPSEDGDIYVVKAGPEFELLARNPMGEVCMATPAISEGVMLIRTVGHVVAIGPPSD